MILIRNATLLDAASGNDPDEMQSTY